MARNKRVQRATLKMDVIDLRVFRGLFKSNFSQLVLCVDRIIVLSVYYGVKFEFS